MIDINNRSRRKFLMNLAKAGVLLPFASHLMGQKAFAAGAAKNILFLYKPNGFTQVGWDPQSTGATGGNELSFALAPLKAWNSNLIVLKNILISTRPDGSGSGGGHSDGLKGCLTGDMDNTGASSIDYMIARKLHELNSASPAEVLSLGVRTGKDSIKIVSGNGSNTRTIPDNNPKAVMERLRGKMNVEPISPLEKSIYDALLTDFDDLSSANLEASRKVKIDEHKNALTRLRDRVNFGSGKYVFNPETEADITQNNTPTAEQKLRFPHLAKAQVDNVVGAFANGLHRVATLQLAAGDEHPGYVDYYFEECLAMNQLAVEQLGKQEIKDFKYHYGHTPSHETDQSSNHGQSRWHNAVMAYALEQLDAQGILNETIVVMFSEVGDHQHVGANGSMVVAGGANSGLTTGRIIDCNHSGNTLQLYGDIARAMGITNIGGPWRNGLI